MYPFNKKGTYGKSGICREELNEKLSTESRLSRLEEQVKSLNHFNKVVLFPLILAILGTVLAGSIL